MSIKQEKQSASHGVCDIAEKRIIITRQSRDMQTLHTWAYVLDLENAF